MSDTDDTDLLLLIPPDFFLVRSDLEDFDSDSDNEFRYQEARDTIVGDLITQVNDLESRICQIESQERSSTRCSTCIDDSFMHQSVISLTESDALRAQLKEQRGGLQNDLTDTSFMVKSLSFSHATPELLFEKEDGIRKFENSSVRTDTVDCNTDVNFGSVTASNYVHEMLNDHVRPNCNKNSMGLESQLSKEKQNELLNEVDSFLLRKQLNTLENDEAVNNDNNHLRISQEGKPFVKAKTDLTVNDIPYLYKGIVDDDSNEHAQSLALNEVYKLVSVMEETQNEMLRKLTGNGLQSSGQDQDKSKETMSRYKKSLGLSSKVLDLEDLSTRSPKSVIEKLKDEQKHNQEGLGTNTTNKYSDKNYLLPQLPSTEDRSNQRTSLSPNRVTVGNYNPIDIVKANLPGRQDLRTTSLGDGKDLSIKNSGFRRQLNFEKPLSPLRASKSRTSLHGDQKSYNLGNEIVQNEIRQTKNEGDRFLASFKTSRSGKTYHNLEEKFNALTMQRASGTSSKESQTTLYNPINNAASDILEQKISSNNLLSLSELWNKEPTFYSDDPNKLRQKLEEERYRRQHCEQQIQALQLRVLEEQEKLAVAVRVDQEKDRAIMQITASWKKLNDHWAELEEQRHDLAQQLQSKSEEFSTKVERWEKEVSQALDLAAGYKEKSEAVQKQMESVKRNSAEQLQEAESQLQKATEENEKLSEENKKLTDQLQTLQQRLAEEEELLSKLKAELEKSRKRLNEFEAENNVLKEQKLTLTTGVKEERNRNSILEQKMNSLQQALNEAYKKEKLAQEEVRVSQERMEVARTELRALYQGQLEAVVKEKLQEFQTQLETAEAALKAELHNKEKHWAEKANDQCRQLHDKFKRDLLRVEEIHKADINSWKEKLTESERLRTALEKKLQEEADRRADIAQRLHSVMETQWREALNIISNPIKALYEAPQEDRSRCQGQGDVRVSRSASTASLGPGEDVPFCQEGMVTYRTSQPSQDQQLKKYIQMLLDRGPGNPVPLQNVAQQDNLEPQTFATRDNGLLDRWIMENEKQTKEQSDRQNQFNKPPWR